MSLSPKKFHHIVTVILLILMIVTGCQSSPMEVTQDTPQSLSPGETPAPELTTTSFNPTESETATATPTQAQPTHAPTLENWKDAPIMPETISARVLEIYADGQAQGRDAASFSVVGDCQSIPYVFMGPFSRGEQQPDASENYLWDAIETFDASFKRWSVTARGGFTAASVLNALQADPNECKPGETPLTCEFRLNNPAFVLITLETWLDPETIDRYEVYLRQIIETVIAKGSVPILLTKADSSELRGEKHVINPVIVNLAYEYQVPVVNFWRAAQYLDNYGIDPDREGFHLSDAGYRLKNTLALRALYTVWTTVEGRESEIMDTGENAVQTEASRSEEPVTPEITIPECSGGCVFFGSAQSQDGAVTAQGVYAYNVATQTLTQVLGAGFDLQDVSADGSRLLVNHANDLFELTLSNGKAVLLNSSFYFYGQQGAYWNAAETDVIFLDQEQPLQTETGTAFTVFPAPQAEGIYFDSGTCTSKDFCESEGVYFLSSDGDLSHLPSYQQPVFSPDGSRVAFLNPAAATKENYYHISYLLSEETASGIASRRSLSFPDEPGFEVYPEVEAFSFSPNNNQLFILYNVYSEYYEKSLRLQTYLWDLGSGIRYDFGKLDGASGSLTPRFAWSPDGSQLLFFLTELTEDGEYRIQIYETDVETGTKLVLMDEALLTSNDYLYLTNLYWR